MTVIARRISSSPARSETQTWRVIVNLLCPNDEASKSELLRVEGVLASVIADEIPATAPIVFGGTGPRVRFYCVYGQDAISFEDCNESALPFNPTPGDWWLSVPCNADDLAWMSAALAKQSKRVVARDAAAEIDVPEDTKNESAMSVSVSDFLKP